MTNMKGTPLTKSYMEYIRELKDLLPKEAFLGDPKKIFHMLGYLLMLVITYSIFRFTQNPIVYPTLSCFRVHCLSCLGFLSHELSHNCIIKNASSKYVVEVISWGINLIPATRWDKVHNQTHHIHLNTRNDPDRQFFDLEKNTGTNFYNIFNSFSVSIKLLFN